MLARSLLVLALILAPGVALADIFVWTDAEGVCHFTNVPTDNRYKLFIKERDKIHLNARLASRPEFDGYIDEAARYYNIDRDLVRAVIKAESGFDHLAVSRAGAQGLMQLMPATAREVQCQDAFDPRDNIHGGVKYLRKLLDIFGDVGLALAAYNAGPEAVMKYRGVPPYSETRTYVDRVLRYYSAFKSGSL